MEKKKVEKISEKKKTSDSKSGLTVDIYDQNGQVVESEILPEEISTVSLPKTMLAQAVRVYLMRQRKGTSSTKTRAQVRGGGKKPWRQKGTGRARAGSIRDPQWRGGGIVFGPKPRDFFLSLPKKMKERVLLGVLSDKFKNKKVFCVKEFSKLGGKTKQFLEFLSKLPIVNGEDKKILIVSEKKNEQVARAVRNLKNLSLITLKYLNFYQILNNDFLLFDKEALISVGNLFAKKLETKKAGINTHEQKSN